MRWIAGIAATGLLMAQSAADLTQVFDQYLAALKANDFQRVTAVYQSLFKQQVLTEYGAAGKQAIFLAAIAEMAPDSYEAATVSPSEGQKVLLRITAKKSVPPEIQKQQNLPPVMAMPMVIEFAREGGRWKMGPPAFGESPQSGEPRRPKDLKMGARTDYKEGAASELGGPVVRAEKQAAGTVYVIRVADDEVAAFVPARLVQPVFAVGKILVMRGAAHKVDTQKFWAEDARLHQQ
jgi:hypothetical protein